MYRGEIVAFVDGRPKANKEEIGLLMATGGRAVVEGSPNGSSSQAETSQDTSAGGGTS